MRLRSPGGMKTLNYIFNEHGMPVAEPEPRKWAAWMARADTSVAQSEIGTAVVCTTFLGLDHNLSATGPPILWETIVFGGPLSEQSDRCAGSREQAEAMHSEMIARVHLRLAGAKAMNDKPLRVMLLEMEASRASARKGRSTNYKRARSHFGANTRNVLATIQMEQL